MDREPGAVGISPDSEAVERPPERVDDEPVGRHAAAARTPRRARPPLVVWALVALHVAVMIMCSILYPPTYGYDETQHIDMAYAFSQSLHVYGPAERKVAAGVAAAQHGRGYPPKTDFTDLPIQPRGERQSFDGQGGPHQLQGGRPNQQVQHPPLYYLMGAAVLRLPGVASLPYDQEIWLLRLLSILLMAPLPLLGWAAARVLLGPGPPALVAAVLPVTMPGLSRIGGSVTNDSLLILLGAVLAWQLARVLAGDLRVRTGAWIGVVLTLALLTKGFALVLPPVVLAGYVVAGLRHRRWPVWPAVAALGLACLGLIWWIRNVVLYGAVQPNGWGLEVYNQIIGRPRPGGTKTVFVEGFLYRLGLRIWGGIGLPETPRLAIQICFAWAIVAVLLIAVGVASGFGGRWSRSALMVLCLPAVLTTLTVAYQSWVLFHTHGSLLVAIQGRYLYVGLAGPAIAFAAGLMRVLPRRWAPWLPGGVLLLGVATQVWAWRTLMQSWWVPNATRGQLIPAVKGAIHGIKVWSPFPPVLTFAPFAASLLLAVVALVLLFRRQAPTGEHRMVD